MEKRAQPFAIIPGLGVAASRAVDINLADGELVFSRQSAVVACINDDAAISSVVVEVHSTMHRG